MQRAQRGRSRDVDDLFVDALTGEKKPSELKVTRFAREGGAPVEIAHKKPHGASYHEAGHLSPADPARALKTARGNGFTVIGVPRRKPKHFEILGRDKDGDLVELHIELDGTLRKSKPADADEPKWADVLARAS